MPEQASLFRSGVPLDSPLEGHLLWDLALITPGLARPGLARRYLYYSLLAHVSGSTGRMWLPSYFHPLYEGALSTMGIINT